MNSKMRPKRLHVRVRRLKTPTDTHTQDRCYHSSGVVSSGALTASWTMQPVRPYTHVHPPSHTHMHSVCTFTLVSGGNLLNIILQLLLFHFCSHFPYYSFFFSFFPCLHLYPLNSPLSHPCLLPVLPLFFLQSLPPTHLPSRCFK